MMRLGLRLAVLLSLPAWLCSALTSAADAQSQSYTFTTINIPDATGSLALGINDSGTIVGYFGTSSSQDYGFIDSNGGITTTTNPLYGISNNGYTVGVDGEGFILTAPSGTSTTYSIAGEYLQAGGVNNSGTVVGTALLGGFNVDAFVYSNGSISQIGDYPYQAHYTGINDNGLIVGYGTPGAVPNPPSPQGYELFPNAINNSGVIAGDALNTTTGLSQGFVYANGQTSLISVPGTLQTYVNGINDQDQIVGEYVTANADGTRNSYGFLGTSSTTPPPSTLDLAKVSQNTYTVGQTTQVPAPIDGYNFVKSVLGSGGFAAEVFQNGNQIIISFRGTAYSDLYDVIKTLLADSSFTANGVDPDFYLQLQQAASLVASIATNPSYAGDNITLTGHSLGGAIAQIIGADTGLPTQAFNAPGAGGLISLPAVQQALSTLQNVAFQNSGPNSNLRMYGDQISLVGTPIGTQETIATSAALQTALNNPLIPTAVTVANTFLDSHDIGLMVQQLGANAAITPGINGPQAYIDIALGKALATGFEYISYPIVGYANFEADPPSGEFFQFAEDGSSPPLYSLILPDLFGVNNWELEELINSQWTSDVSIDPLTTYYFDTDVSKFEFWAVDSAGNDLSIPGGFAFDVEFGSSGTLNATVTAASVPEPASLLLLISAIFSAIVLTTMRTLRVYKRNICGRVVACHNSMGRPNNRFWRIFGSSHCWGSVSTRPYGNRHLDGRRCDSGRRDHAGTGIMEKFASST